MAAIKLHRMVTLTALLQYCGHTLAIDTKRLHQHMSPEDLRATFHVDSQDFVPEYEVVHPQAATPYSKYQQDSIGPPPQENLTDIWSVLNQFSAKTQPDRTHEDDRRGPDNVEEIEEGEEDLENETGGGRFISLDAFGRKLHLRLKETEGLLGRGRGLRMFESTRNHSSENGVQLTELPQDDNFGAIYQDTKNQAALLVHRSADGKLLVEGTIGRDLVMKPVPESVRHLTATPGDSLDEEAMQKVGREKRDEVYHKHIVFRRSSEAEEDAFSDYALMEPDHLSKKFRRRRDTSRSSRNKREAPYIIFPEILVIVDYDGYRLHGGDNVQIKRYFVSFWNGVDLRYKLLKGPKIRISIAGIIISRGRDATPYLERNRVGRDAIDSAAALTDMGKYLFRERRLPVYDIAVAVTKLDMCRRQYANDACNRGTAGFAYVGGACVVNKRLEKVNSVAIIEDTGGFSGIIVAAHEVGHLLGAVHDGSPPPSYLGGPGAEKCRWEDGFIMSDLRHTEKGFRWSSCSINSFHHFLNGDTATCLFNSPHEDESLPRVLPGKLLTLDAQCRKDRGTSACFKDERVCSQLFCFDAGSGYCVAYRPAAEGSPCGDGQYCINGKCVAEHENIIPDYSQNTPSYIRREDIENLATQARPVYVFPNATSPRPTTTPFAPPLPTTPVPKFDYDQFFAKFNNRRTTQSPQKIFDEFFRTSTTESAEQRQYREFYATSTTESAEEIARREFYRTSTTESPEAVAYREFYRTSTTESPEELARREFYRTSTTESPEEIAYREFYRTSTTEDPAEAARREFYRTSTTESPEELARKEFYRTSTTESAQEIAYREFYRTSTLPTRFPFKPFTLSTTRNPYDFSEFDPKSPHYFRKTIDNNSLGSEIRQTQTKTG